jgi:mannose-6-phosphate isomerase-like protein (cupin superfamily)
MRLTGCVLSGLLALLAVTAHSAAQQPAATAPRLYWSAADIAGLIAKAKAERKGDQAVFSAPVLPQPYRFGLEYRMNGLQAPVMAHDGDAEIFFVLEGTGTALTGGKLRDEKRAGTNATGSGIDEGVSRRIAKGDVLLVPDHTPHMLTPSGGPLAVLPLHVLPGATPAGAPAPAQVFASAADLAGLIEKAKAGRKSDQPNFIQPVVRSGSYLVNLEYRMSGIEAPASRHENDAELFIVVDGTATFVTGGKLHDEKPSSPGNFTGKGIDGGESRRMSKGDLLLVPADAPHLVIPSNGALAVMSIHLPMAAPKS